MYRYCLLALMLILSTMGVAQVPSTQGLGGRPVSATATQRQQSPNATTNTANNDSTSNEQTAKGIIFNIDIPDSTLLGEVFIFHLAPTKVKIETIEHPTFSASGLNFFDHLDRIDGNYYLSKGGIGQSHYSIYPHPTEGIGWMLQPDINIGYGKTMESVNFFHTMRPFTVLGYASSLYREYQIHASHTQNITPRWNISLDVDFLNPEGIYANSSVKNSYADITSHYYSADARYQMYAGVVWQKLRMGESGGMSSDSIFRNHSSLSSLSGLPVVDASRRTLFNQVTAFTRQSYNFVRQVLRTKECEKIVVTDSNTLDTIVWIDTLRPEAFAMINKGVTNLDIKFDTWKHRLADSAYRHSLTANLMWSNDAYPDSRWPNPLKINLGLKPEYHRVQYSDSTDTYYHLFNIVPYAAITKRLWFGSFSGSAELALGSGYRRGDSRVAADYTLVLDSLRLFKASFVWQLREADFFYHHFRGNGLKWDNDNLSKTAALSFDLNYKRSDLLDINLTANRLDGHTWLTPALTVQQGDKAMWLLQGRIMLHTKLWGWLCYDMQQMLQYSSDETQMRVPHFASKNSLYTDIALFKRALTLQVGADVRYNTAFYADSYSPEAGAFYHQNDVKVGNFPWIDFFVNLQLKRAVIYAKVGHLNSIWESYPDYFILPHYPGNKLGLYYGLIWKFFD